MANAQKSSFYLGGAVQGYPPSLSQISNELGVLDLQNIRPPRPAVEAFSLLFDVSYLKPYEICITVSNDCVITISAKHERRRTTDGLWLTRECVYTYEVSPEVVQNELHALWYENDYLLIKATASNSDQFKDRKLIQLVPKRVKESLKRPGEINVVKDLIEGIWEKATSALKLIP